MPDSDASGSFAYCELGHYIVRVDKCEFFENRKRDECLAFNMTCVHVFDDDDGRGHRVGQEFSKVYNDRFDATPGAIKSAVAAILDIDPDDVTKKVLLRCVDDKQPLAGRFVEIQNRPHVTQGGTDIVIVNWKQSVDEDELADILDDDAYDKFVLGKKGKSKPSSSKKRSSRDEDDDDEEERPRSRRRRARDDDDEEDERPARRRKKKAVKKKKRRAEVEDDDDVDDDDDDDDEDIDELFA